ncbi:MAG: hypothetical protein E7602_08110 [Ruminococcaceae bacterium]|nr:hypothetical protein [Oscillospiraceae bacterium]
MEQIYTIPVNESFEDCAKSGCDCPLCKIYDNLENKEVEMALGPSMMEPSTRELTNEKGFCRDHFKMMLERNNRLSLALILESHLDTVKGKLSGNFLDALFGTKANKALKGAQNVLGSCFICERIDNHFEKMVETTVLLYDKDPDFREKLMGQKYFCLPHYKMMLECARNELDKKKYNSFFSDVSSIENKYFEKLGGDVSWFCKKFDYRYDNEPWYDSKDAPDRAVTFLVGGVNKSGH